MGRKGQKNNLFFFFFSVQRRGSARFFMRQDLILYIERNAKPCTRLNYTIPQAESSSRKSSIESIKKEMTYYKREGNWASSFGRQAQSTRRSAANQFVNFACKIFLGAVNYFSLQEFFWGKCHALPLPPLPPP